MTATLSVRDLCVAIGAVNVLRGVSLEVEPGEVRGLVGESGAGKSMLGRAVLGLYPHEISGGMRQRVLIAMAFACDPGLVIADEPTTALDVTVQRDILRLIAALQRSVGTALLFVTHDLGVVSKLCERVTISHAGRVLESGPVEQIFRAPRHDYTRALLAATPRWDRPADALHPVPPALAARLQAEAAEDDRRLASADPA